jgi:hypothetical protein
MPRFDGTGPFGSGMGTGRRMGSCYGGRGMCGRRFFSKDEEKEILKDEITDLENEIKAVKERLSEIEDQK